MHFPDLEVCCDWCEFFLGLETKFWDLASDVQMVLTCIHCHSPNYPLPRPYDQPIKKVNDSAILFVGNFRCSGKISLHFKSG